MENQMSQKKAQLQTIEPSKLTRVVGGTNTEPQPWKIKKPANGGPVGLPEPI
jgi:hypothetical protein